MKQFPKTEVFSLFSVIAGIAGMAMQSWMFSAADASGLLIRGHIGEVLSYLLLAVIVALSFMFLKNMKSDGEYDRLFPKSPVAAAGSLLAAAGIVFSTLTPAAMGSLKIVVQALSVIAGLALVLGGAARLRGKRPNCLLYAVVTVFLIFRTLAFCQSWSAEVQMQNYFFPLLASLFLLLTAYYRAALSADLSNCRQYFLFRQLALVCCLISLAGSDRIFYLSGAVWMVTDFCVPKDSGKYAQ